MKEKGITLAIAFFICMSTVVGYMIEEKGYLSLENKGMLVTALLLIPVVSIMLYTVYEWMACANTKENRQQEPWSRKQRAGVFLFLFLCWGIVLLGVYPGFFLYDATDELNQVLTRVFTTHHPIFHVLYLGGIVQAGYKILGSYNAGICILMLVQEMCFAAGFTYMLETLYRAGASRRYCILAGVLLGIFPVMPMMVLCSSKDALFSLVMVLWMVETYIWQQRGYEKVPFLWVCWTILLILLRNNAIYALAAWGIIVLCFVKKGKKQLLTGLLLGMAIAKISAFGLMMLFHASGGEYQEILTVPIQQLTRVYTLEPETFTEEERETLYRYLPEEYLQKYEPKLSDSVKIGFQNELFARNKADFCRLWYQIGRKAPMTYVNAWLLTSYGYWYPDATVDVYRGHTVYTFTYEESSYFGYETEQPGVRNSKLPVVDKLYRFLSLENWKEKAPVPYLFFSPGCMLWVMILGVGYVWKRKGISGVMPYGSILLVIATLLLGPTFLPRYVFFLWPCNLFLIGEIMAGDNCR